MGFFQALFVMILIVGIFLGIGYWIYFFAKKKFPNLKYDIKYKLFKKKYKEDDVRLLSEYHDKGYSVGDVGLSLLVDHKLDMNKVKEMCYIYEQMKLYLRTKKVKGGNKNGK